MSILINLATEFTGKKAFKEADKAVDKLTKGTKKLAAAFGVGLSTAAVVAFGKASVKAFVEAEKANTRLANVVENLGLSFATAGIQKNLDEISAKAGIAGEALVEAFQPLITTTGSVTKSQELLNLALDVSAGSGKDIIEVSKDIALAYTGVTRGLRKYNLGLTQAELKAADFNKVQGLLTKQFAGSSAAYLETYAGKMQVLTEAAGNAQEIIGGGLVDALMALGGDTSVEDLAKDMNDLATYTANVIRGIGNLGKSFQETPDWLKKLNTYLAFGIGGQLIGKGVSALEKSGGTKQSTGFSFFGSPMESTQRKRDAAAAAKAEKDAAKRAKELAKVTKANTAELKKQALTKKQSALFDLEKIGLVAALQGKISEEERLRLNLQLALLTGNDALATKLSTQLANSIDSTGKLAKDLTTLPDANNPFKSWDAFLDTIIAKARLAASIGGGGSIARGQDFVSLTPTVQSLVTGAVTGSAGSTSAGDVYITVNGSVLSEQDLVDAVQNGLNYNALAGKRSDIGRIAGMFG